MNHILEGTCLGRVDWVKMSRLPRSYTCTLFREWDLKPGAWFTGLLDFPSTCPGFPGCLCYTIYLQIECFMKTRFLDLVNEKLEKRRKRSGGRT